jgi:hypothetical protein
MLNFTQNLRPKMYGHVCRSRSCATLAPESMANQPLPKLTRTTSSADIAERYLDINSPTRSFPIRRHFRLNSFKIFISDL